MTNLNCLENKDRIYRVFFAGCVVLDVLKVVLLVLYLFAGKVLPFVIMLAAGVRSLSGWCGSRRLMLVAFVLSIPLVGWNIINKGRRIAYSGTENNITMALVVLSLIAFGFWIAAIRHTSPRHLHIWIEILLVPAVIIWWVLTTKWIVH